MTFFREKKNLIALLFLLFLAVAIPLTLYLIRHPQIFRGRATGSSISFVGLSGTTPVTQSQNVQLKFTYGGTTTSPSPPPPVPPPPPPPPLTASQGSLTITNLASQTRSDGVVLLNLGASWSNLSSPTGSLYLVYGSNELFIKDITTVTGSYTFQYTRASSVYNSQVKYKIKRDGVDVLTSNTITAGSGTSAPPPPSTGSGACTSSPQCGTGACTSSGLKTCTYYGPAPCTPTNFTQSCTYTPPPPPPPPPPSSTSCIASGQVCTASTASQCCSGRCEPVTGGSLLCY